MFRAFLVALIYMFYGQAALANAPDQSLWPKARPLGITSFVPRIVSVPVFFNAKIRPKPRPVFTQIPQMPATTPTRPDKMVLALGGSGPLRSLRPAHRPENMRRVIARAQKTERQSERRAERANPDVRQPRKGSVCGDRAIRGQVIARIRGPISGCGIEHPVKITEVDGVMLSRPATIDCPTAKALKTWVRSGAKPAIGRMGGGLETLGVVAHYVCRNRNNKRGARLSEHAKGKAVDIAWFGLKDGSRITVSKGWNDRRHGPVLKKMHRAACGPFGTVLGPNSDKYHRNHFHFDTARHRGGPYCR